MKKKSVLMIVVLILMLMFNPYTLDKMGGMFRTTSSKTVHLPFSYANNSFVTSFQNGLLTYDGLSLRLIDSEGIEVFDVTINADNYSISTSQDRIFVLDIAKKSIFILDEKGSVITQEKTGDMPKRVVGLEDGGFLIHYFTDVYVEGIRVFSKSGKEVKDMPYPNVTITLVRPVDATSFLVTGFFRNADTLDNSVYYYTNKGELQFATQINNAILGKIVPRKDKFVMMDVSSLIVGDKAMEETTNFDFTLNLKDILATDKEIYVLASDNSVKTLNYDFQFLAEKSSQAEILGILFHKGKLLYYTDNSVVYGAVSKQYSKDVMKVVDIGEKVAVVFKEGIQLLTLKE